MSDLRRPRIAGQAVNRLHSVAPQARNALAHPLIDVLYKLRESQKETTSYRLLLQLALALVAERDAEIHRLRHQYEHVSDEYRALRQEIMRKATAA